MISVCDSETITLEMSNACQQYMYMTRKYNIFSVAGKIEVSEGVITDVKKES